jgi:hypothetical protein
MLHEHRNPRISRTTLLRIAAALGAAFMLGIVGLGCAGQVEDPPSETATPAPELQDQAVLACGTGTFRCGPYEYDPVTGNFIPNCCDKATEQCLLVSGVYDCYPK